MKTFLACCAILTAGWFASLSAADVVLKSSITSPQPMTGLVMWPAEAAELHDRYGDCFSLEFSYCLPCRVVTGCADDGTILYDWQWFEDILDDVASRGHQLVARFRYEYPGSKDVDGKTAGMTAVPQYIKDREDYHETYNKVKGDGPTYYADWSNAELQRFTKQFYTDFAARYGEDPRLAFVEVGFGHWSEYHIYGTRLQLGVNFPSKVYQREFFLHLGDVMGELPWGVSIDAADDEYSPVVDDEVLMSLQFGNFDDSFMHKDHEIGSADGYNEECWNAIGRGSRWRASFAGGEISYYSDDDQRDFLAPEGIYGHTWEEQAAKYHITFMIANDAPEGRYATPERFRNGSMATGYRFVVKKCRVAGGSTFLTVANEGVAPIYRDACFAIGSVTSGATLRGLCPGEEMTVEIPFPLSVDDSGNLAERPVIISPYVPESRPVQYEADVAVELDGSGVEEAVVDPGVGAVPMYDISGRKITAPVKGRIVIAKDCKILF